MGAMTSLGLREIVARRGITLAVVLGVAVVVLIFLTVESVAGGIGQTLTSEDEGRILILQKGVGMVWWSYLPETLLGQLRAMGVKAAVPEIFALREGEPGDYLLFRGVPLDRYREVERFTILEGRPLGLGDEGKVMVGRNIAHRKRLRAGQTLVLRGRPFTIAGIFQTGLVADNEVWLDIGVAARLFNFEGTYSAVIARGDQALARTIESLGFQVVRESELWDSWRGTLRGFHRLLRMVSGILAAAAVLGVMNLAFTVVKQRDRQIAILRSLGFGRRHILAYVLTQTVGIAGLGYIIAMVAAWALLRGLAVYAWGFTLRAQIRPEVLGLAFLGAVAIGVFAGAYPAMVAGRVNVTETLRRE